MTKKAISIINLIHGILVVTENSTSSTWMPYYQPHIAAQSSSLAVPQTHSAVPGLWWCFTNCKFIKLEKLEIAGTKKICEYFLSVTEEKGINLSFQTSLWNMSNIYNAETNMGIYLNRYQFPHWHDLNDPKHWVSLKNVYFS